MRPACARLIAWEMSLLRHPQACMPIPMALPTGVRRGIHLHCV